MSIKPDQRLLSTTAKLYWNAKKPVVSGPALPLRHDVPTRPPSFAGSQTHEVCVVRRSVKQIPSSVSVLKRASELWPYLLIAVSLVGWAYIAFNGIQ
jgi:hypothetical protein